MKIYGNAVLTEQEKKSLIIQYDFEDFLSEFHFLKDHKGLRKGQYHLFLGETGSGKTSLIRAILKESCVFHHAVWLSTEESYNDWKWKLSKSGMTDLDLSAMTFIEEEDEYQCIEDYFAQLKARMIELKAGVLFFDNFTTSYLSRLSNRDQEKAPRLLMRLAKELDIPIVVAAHTSKETKSNMNALLDADNVRGNQTLANRAPYMYIMQIWKDDAGIWYPILRTRKSRFHKQDIIYALHYDVKKELYVSDCVIPYSKVLEIYQNRFRLSDDSNKRKESNNNSPRKDSKNMY